APATLHVSLTGYGGAAGEQTIVGSYTANPGEDPDAFLQQTALAVTSEIEERWKGGQLLQFDHEVTLAVLVNYDDISQWVGIRRRLADLALIRRTDLVSLTRRQAIVDIVYIGDDGQLRLALAQRDLALVPAGPGAASSSEDAPAVAGSAAPAPLWQLTLTGTTSNPAPASQPRP
ncbi:MAG: hypothetical protein JO128_12565, partial [Alphaproteobacteria bacterium]|nr:hypothetical protein [Alphaproteobacteria bacterium]